MDYKEFKTLLESKDKESEVDRDLIEICLMMSVTFDAIVIDHVQSLCDTIGASSSENGTARYGTIQLFCKDGTCRAMNNRLKKLIRQYSDKLSYICNFDEERIANAMDAAYEILKEPMFAYYRYLQCECESGNAQDYVMLSKILFIICILDLAANIYDNITSKNNFQIIGDIPKYKFLRMDTIYEQVVKMLSYMDFKDNNDNELKIDLKAIKMSKQSLEICDDIISIVYSAEYVNKIFIARTGNNPNLGMGEFKSLLPSLENRTLTMEEYSNKYKNLFI